MRKKRPFGITFIGYFYVFGVIVLLLSLGVKQEIQMNIRFGIPFIPEFITRVSIIILSLIMAYGYLKMEKWGYWIMIIYSTLFMIVSFYQVTTYNSQPFIGNAIFSIIVLIYTFIKRKYFLGNIKEVTNNE